MADPNASSRVGKADMILGAAVIGLLIVLLVPLPSWFLDLLLVVNLSLSILVLLIVLSSERPLDLSTFPTLLLFASLFRLSLNVASTRLILLQGKAGEVIQAFGEFVVGGSVIVGVVIFLILVVIQFVVITKGAGRISEVAARFTLDAMPGKQMTIDADLNGGLITPEEAVQRRKELSREAEFYGAMDGASKFVRGDAVAGLIITAVNILGGVGIALGKGMAIGQAFTTYTILTIGDGLISQIPALIVATSGAIIVTKASTEQLLADEFTSQITGRKRGLLMAGGIVAGLGLIPGLPSIPFLVLGGGLLLASRKPRKEEAPEKDETPASPEEVAEQQSQELRNILKIDRMGVELGYRLLYLVEKSKGGSLLGHIAQLRKRFAGELGLILPPIRVTDNVRLPATGYRVLVNGQTIASGELRPGALLAMNPGTAEGNLKGEKTKEPTFGLPAKWIPEDRRSEAEMKGYTVVEPVSVLVTHVSELVRSHAHEILTRDDVKTLVENIQAEQPAVVDDLIPNVLTYGEVHRVLRCLLEERVSVRNLGSILEVLSENAATVKEPEALAELARKRISRSVIEPFLDEEGRLKVLTLDPTLERRLIEISKNQEHPDGPGLLRMLLDQMAREIIQVIDQGHDAVVLVRSEIRTFLRDLLKTVAPRAAVLSYSEAATAKDVEPITVIGMETGEKAA